MNTQVTFELAKLLKEKGFDVPVRNYYLQKEKGNYLHEGFEDSHWGDNRIVNWNKDVVGIKPFKGFLSAPTISEVIMWLYEKHGIWIVVNPHKGEDDLGKPFMEFDPEVWSFTNECIFHNTKLLYFNSPTEAYEAAIEYSLNNLL